MCPNAYTPHARTHARTRAHTRTHTHTLSHARARTHARTLLSPPPHHHATAITHALQELYEDPEIPGPGEALSYDYLAAHRGELLRLLPRGLLPGLLGCV